MPSNFFRHDKALIHPEAQIGEGTRIWAFVNIQSGAEIGRACNICDGCFIEKGSRIGNGVTLKNGVNVFEGVTLEDNVFCGSHTTFINDRYPRAENKQWSMEKTLVKRGATIGSNATILCGLTIGAYAFIAAGSVVTKDVGDYALYAGNPAHFCGYVCRCGKKLNSELTCGCGRSYVLSDKRLQPKV